MSEEIKPLSESRNRYTAGVDPASGPDESVTVIVSGDGTYQAVDATIPVEVAPFNDMARYFGAAGTVMANLQQRGVWWTTESAVYDETMQQFRFYGKGFCRKVADIVVGYYHANPFNRTAWDAAVRERQRMLDQRRCTIQEHGPKFEDIAEADRPEALRLLRTIWP